VATGASNREIGDRLFISTRTVEKHVERLLQKAGTTRSGLADLARRAGLLRT
jgi:DNA-binding NarL/FixJ family response regulator